MNKSIITLGLLLVSGIITEASATRSVAEVTHLTNTVGATLNSPSNLIVAGDYAYCIADTTNDALRQLWFSCWTNQEECSIDYVPGSERSFVSFAAHDQNQYLFTIETTNGVGSALWRWNGGVAGSIIDSAPSIKLLTVVAGGGFYVKSNELWFFDNAISTNWAVHLFSGYEIEKLIPADQAAVIITKSLNPPFKYKIYYTSAEKDSVIEVCELDLIDTNEIIWLEHNNMLFFSGVEIGETQQKLFKVPVASPVTYDEIIALDNVRDLTAVGSSIFFTSDSSNQLFHLPAGSPDLYEIQYNTNSVSGFISLTSVNDNTLYFVATNSPFGSEIWRCSVNQTDEYFAECLNTNIGEDFNPSLLYEFGVGLAFAADHDGDGTNTLWISRYHGLTEATDASGKALAFTDYSSFTEVGYDLWFSATDDFHGADSLGNILWKMLGNIRVPIGTMLDCPTDEDWDPVVVAEGGPLEITYGSSVRPYTAARIVHLPEDGESRVLFTDPGAVCNVNWTNYLDEPKSLKYEIEYTAADQSETKLIYDTEGASRAPTVDLSDVPHNPVLCENHVVYVSGSTNYTGDTGGGTNTISEAWSGNVWIDESSHLHADVVDDTTGNNATDDRIVLLFEDGGESYQGHEVVCVKQYLPDAVDTNDVGSELKSPNEQYIQHIPYDLSDNGFPFVAAGKMISRDDDGYIYQHNDFGNLSGQVYATRENDDELKMEIFWNRDGLYDVVWPYHMKRYRTEWPDETAQRLIRRADSADPQVIIPYELNPYKMPEEKYPDTFDHGYLVGQEFYSDGPGYSLLLLESGPVQSRDWLEFVVVKSVMNSDTNAFMYNYASNAFGVAGSIEFTNRTEMAWPIGTAVTNKYHHGAKAGYLYYNYADDVIKDDYFHPGFYGDADAQGMHSGDIFAVNEGTLEVWWSNETHTNVNAHGIVGASIQWPSYVVMYSNLWPYEYSGPLDEDKDLYEVIIAAQTGTGPLGMADDEWELYYQNDPNKLGYNPNDEHAIVMLVKSGEDVGVFPLRSDLWRTNQLDCSKPYLVIENQSEADGEGNPVNELDIYRVVAEQGTNVFHSSGNLVGSLIEVPYPLQWAPQIICSETTIPNATQSAIWRDRKNWLWARALGEDASMTNRTVQYYYNVLDGFYFPEWYRSEFNAPPAVQQSDGELSTLAKIEVPWLDALEGGVVGTPVNFTYDMEYKPDIPTMDMGQTLTKSLNNLPAVWNQRGVEIIYQQASYTNDVIEPDNVSVSLIDPLLERKVKWPVENDGSEKMPSDLKGRLLQTVDGKSIFKDLPAHLRKRLVYDEIQNEGYLRFAGRLIEPSPGNHYLLLNAISIADSNVLVNTYEELELGEEGQTFMQALDELIVACDVVYVERDEPTANLALSTGRARAGGYVTLAFNNSTNTDINAEGDPISLGVLYVTNNLYTGDIFPVNSDNAFDENLVMRHTLDFGGEGEYVYEWRALPANLNSDITATNPDLPGVWTDASGLYVNEGGTNEMSLIVRGNPEYVLEDKYFTLRYKPASKSHPLYIEDDELGWSDWVTPPKIAMSWVTRVMDGINPFEQRIKTFDTYTPSTLMTMLEQVGIPYAGAVPLNLDHVDDYGLIEIYQTVFERALDLSGYGGNGDHRDGFDNTMLLAAGRLADLYTILGNEAYADAQDPTIGFGTEHGEYGAEASSIFCFRNIVPSLLDEELCLLRGRDNSAEPGVDISPHYNRLPWNMSWDMLGGEVAYALNYEITDVANEDGARVEDGLIDAYDAVKLYPQGHGDAWGHYLSAISYYYRLLHTRQFQWEPRTQTIELNLQNVDVDFLDERKFAKAAAARARTGSELLGLAHRKYYDTDPKARLTGYADSDPHRCWGVGDWASRAGQGAYFDWVVGNAMLPETSTNNGMAKVDRTTVVELTEIAELGREVQQKLDDADRGLNPLGLAGNVVPFDISPSAIDQGQTHYEQIYVRAVTALNNAGTVFDHAQNASQQLRRQFDSHEDFVNTVQEREFDFENRLIELYGYPYGDDIGPGKTYPQGYEGPDYHHYDYVDLTDLLGVVKTVEETNVTVDVKHVAVDGTVASTTNEITVHYAGDLSFFNIKPPDWTVPRRAQGEIQMARSDLIQAIGRYLRAEIEFNNLEKQIEDQVDLLQMQYEINKEEILILNETKNSQENINQTINNLRAEQRKLRKIAQYIPMIANAITEATPDTVGVIMGMANGFVADPLGSLKAAAKQIGIAAADVVSSHADNLGAVEHETSQSKEIVSLKSNIEVTTLKQGLGEIQALRQLEQLVRSEASSRLGLYTEMESISQAAGRYHSSVQKAKRIEAERLRFRRQTAGQIQDYRYKDAAFRIFRNDALQRYRAQFDLAARYAYLAARAYGYETCLLDEESAGGFGGNALQDQIVRARTIGYLSNNQPVWGSDAGGLAEALGEMDLNWFAVGPQLGFDNPQTETGRFSLRHELFRILPGNDGDHTWREMLQNCVVDNICDIPEFEKYCIPFNPTQEEEPGIVIPFNSCVNFGHNFFGWLAGGGDNSYDSANFATKVRSVGIWFSNYDTIQDGGLINTPRVYLVPVGSDIMRRPQGDRGDIVEFDVLDQALPLPMTVGDSELGDPSFVPLNHLGNDTMAQPRRHGSIRAYHDAGMFNDAETMNNSRLVGRSVWNTQWMLIIPAGALHSDREEALQRFINGALLPDGVTRDGNGIKDIKLFFQTYAYEGL